MKKLFLLLISSISILANAQESSNFGIKFNGFVKTDFFYDTREVVNSREGHFLLYPDAESLDANGEDIKAHPSTNFLSIQSRLSGAISAPDAFGAKTSGLLEADFFGNLNDENGFRLRHAYAKLNWKRTELLMGQTWNPMFVAEAFPAVISFNTGAPFQPFSRNPQIRLSQKMGDLKLMAVAYEQRDFTSTGPTPYSTTKDPYKSADNVASSIYLRNSSIPNLHLQLQYKPDSTEHLFGIGADYKCIQPETYTVTPNTVSGTKKSYKTDEKLNSISYMAFAKLEFKPIVIRTQVIYAQNATDLTMIGGYAIAHFTDSVTGAKKFTNLNTGSAWIDMNTKGKRVQFGIFGGYTKNYGSDDAVKTTYYYGRGTNIDDIYRIAPRVVFIAGKMSLALEVEHTVASYGKKYDSKGAPINCTQEANTRYLASCIYKF